MYLLIKAKSFYVALVTTLLGTVGMVRGEDVDILSEGIDFTLGKGEYSPIFEKQGRPERFISNYNKTALEGVYALLNDADYSEYWRDAYFAAGIIGAVDLNAVDLKAFLGAVEKLEELVMSYEKETVERIWWLEHLEFAYMAVGRHGYDVWKPFFDERLTVEHWNNQVPVSEFRTRGGRPFTMTVFDLMVVGASIRGEDETEGWLRDLIENHPYLSKSMRAKQRYQIYIGNVGLKMSGKETKRAGYESYLEFYHERLQNEKKSEPKVKGSTEESFTTPHLVDSKEISASSFEEEENGRGDGSLLSWIIGFGSVFTLLAILIFRLKQ